MKPVPLTPKCQNTAEAAELAILGISPFNSQFTSPYIRRLVTWANGAFPAFCLYIPDSPTVHTLIGLGYSPAKARRKARRQVNYLKNKLNHCLEELGFSDDRRKATILSHQALESCAEFQSKLAFFSDRYATIPWFRDGVRLMTKAILESKRGQWNLVAPLDGTAIDIAAQYVLDEIPVILNGAELLGQRSTVFCYHQCPALIRTIFERCNSDWVSPDQGYLLLPETLETTLATEPV